MNPLLFDPQKKAALALAIAFVATCWLASWFIIPTLWAIYIGVGIWPTFTHASERLAERIPRMNKHFPSLVAIGLLLTFCLILGLSVQAGLEEAKNWASGDALASMKGNFESSGLRQLVDGIPFVGTRMTRYIQNFDLDGFAERNNLTGLLFEGGGQWGRDFFSAVGSSLYCAFALAIILGRAHYAWSAVQAFGSRLLGDSFVVHLGHQAALTRSIFNSIVVLGLVETILFWAAYSQAGMHQPALLALLTGAASVLPFFATFFSAASCLSLALSGDLPSALALGVFSAVVLIILDPIIRPLLAGKNTEMPYWLTTIAMIAGVQSLGLVGLFVGPQMFLLLRHLIDVTSVRGAHPKEPPIAP